MIHQLRLPILFAFLFTAFVAFTPAHAEQAPVKILMGGTATLKKYEVKKAEIEKAAGGPVDLSISPFETALTPFFKGMVDGMTTGMDLPGTIAAAERKGLGKFNPGDYDFLELQHVTMKIGVNPANPVKAISKQQMTDILNGKITTWEPITGEKTPLKVFVARSYAAGVKALADAYTSGENSKHVTFVVDKEGVMRAMQADPGAIGFFNEKDKMGSFEPKFFESDAHFGTSLIIKKTARPEVKKVFEAMKSFS